MSRWHDESCLSPDVHLSGDSVLCCRGCGITAKYMLQRMEQTTSNPASTPPPDEPRGQMNLSWPPGVRYVRTQSDGKTIEIERPSPDDVRHPFRLASTSAESGDIITPPAGLTQLSPVYGPALAPDQFRLICLSVIESDSISHHDLLHMDLEVHQDHNCPDYEAVSYTWGDENNDSSLCRPIYIGDYWDILLQTKNCWAMLQYLRPKRGIRLLWVDAICINQNDMTDRGNQVAKMGQIYSQCSQVVMWLGSDLVLQTPGVYPRRHRLSELGNSVFPRFPSQEESCGSPQQNFDIRALLERRYFSRVWVIQELILAPRVLFPIGDLVFWADAATFSKERGSTLPFQEIIQKTKAPWFEYLAQGSLRVDDYPKLMALTSKSQATDDRDRLFGVLGLYEKREGELTLLPDYSLSFQHLSIGFFAYCIIVQRKFQLLSKAAGVSQGRSSFTWVPEWRSGESWDRIFKDLHEAYEQPELKAVKVAARKLLQPPNHGSLGIYPVISCLAYLARDLLPWESMQLRTDQCAPSVHETRPWNKTAFIDTDTGALILEMTKLFSIKSVPKRIGPLDLGKPGPAFSLYEFQPNTTFLDTSPYHCIPSTFDLDQIIEPNDEIFILNPAPLSPVEYLVLRPTGNDGHFKLVTYSSFLFLFNGLDHYPFNLRERINTVGLRLLHGTVADDIDRISRFSRTPVHNTIWNLGDNIFVLSEIFPGFLTEDKFQTMEIWALLPLFLATARESVQSDAGSFEQQYSTTFAKYLALLPERWKPQIIGEYINLNFEVSEWESMWTRCRVEFTHTWGVIWQYYSEKNLGCWKELGREFAPTGSPPTPGIPSRTIKDARVKIRCRIFHVHATICSSIPPGLLELYKAGLLGESDSDVEARLRAGPSDEDFKTPSPYRDEKVQRLFTQIGVDGRVCQVHIV